MAYHRSDYATQINLAIPNPALQLLRKHAGSQRAYGQFIARLLYEHVAREEERARLLRDFLAWQEARTPVGTAAD